MADLPFKINIETENTNITQNFASGQTLPAFVSGFWRLISLYAHLGTQTYSQIFYMKIYL